MHLDQPVWGFLKEGPELIRDMEGVLKVGLQQECPLKDVTYVVVSTILKCPVDNLRKSWVLEERRPKDSHLDNINFFKGLSRGSKISVH